MSIGYSSPSDLERLFQAMQAMPRHHLFAGGTDLHVRRDRGMITVENIINLLGVAEMQGIRETGGMLDLGSLATHAELASHPAVQRSAGALAQAALQVGSPQIRNMGTLGGNMCNASPAADTATPLLVFDAVAVASKGMPVTERRIPIKDFFTGPGRTSLEPGEVLTRVHIPVACSYLGTGSAFIKLAKRKSLAISVINGSAWVAIAGGSSPCIAEARIALGAVAPTPIRLPEVEQWLKERPLTKEVFEEAGQRAKALIKPISDIRSTAAYRLEVSAVLVTRLLAAAVEEAYLCTTN